MSLINEKRLTLCLHAYEFINYLLECFLLGTTNIDDIGGKRGIVRIYSSGVKTTLKVGLAPMETTINETILASKNHA